MLTRLTSVHVMFRFYAKLAELRQRIRANSMPTLNKDLPEEDSANNESFQTSTLPKTYRKHNHELSTTSSLPRLNKPRMQTVLETQQLELSGDQEKPPLPPKPSPPQQFSKFIISPQPFRRTDDAKLSMINNSQHEEWYVLLTFSFRVLY